MITKTWWVQIVSGLLESRLSVKLCVYMAGNATNNYKNPPSNKDNQINLHVSPYELVNDQTTKRFLLRSHMKYAHGGTRKVQLRQSFN